MRRAAVPSPCTGVCRIEPSSGRCAGCLRSLDEIAAWPALDDAARLALWRQLRARRAAATPGPLEAPCAESGAASPGAVATRRADAAPLAAAAAAIPGSGGSAGAAPAGGPEPCAPRAPDAP
jgi:hypothetical protein